MKYRVRENIDVHGRSVFLPQKRILGIWFDIGWFTYDKLPDAWKYIHLRNAKSIYHYEEQ